MSDDRRDIEDPNALAAEYALGVLTGDALKQAEAKLGSDRGFHALVNRWTGRFAWLLADVPEVQPPTHVWDAISATTSMENEPGNVISLRRRLNRWRAAAIGMTAVAASLGLFVVVRPPETIRVEPPAVAPMVALLGEEQQVKVVASWDANARQLVLAVPQRLSADPAHSHELWIIPTGGKPVSIGTLSAADQSHVRLAEALAQLMREGATIAISVEPRGGSPTGAPTGPVVASGSLKRA